jgi:sigma-E factor negative regulatory protein RseB
MSLPRVLLALAGSMFVATAPAWATEPTEWIGRIVSAAQRLTYSGTFVYESAGRTETSRITHVVDASGEREKLEVLDGSPREVVRTNEEVRCFLPAERMVIIDRQGSRKAFPARLPASFEELTAHYRLRKGDVGRVAGFETQLLVLEPKDNLRYGHMLWADTGSGLLLKARMVNEKNEPIEQFYFTQLQIGGAISREVLRPRFSEAAAQWHTHDAKTVEPVAEEGRWVFRSEVPGFRRTAGMKRQLQDGAPPTMHYVFSDGLAAISVFIEPLVAGTPAPASRMYSTGAVNVYKRVQGDHAVIIVGEVPPKTLRLLGDGIAPGRR